MTTKAQLHRGVSPIGRPQLNVLESKINDIELLLEGFGMGYDRLPATATEPAEEIGLSVGYNLTSGLIEIGTTHEVLTTFAVDTPLVEISKWIESHERESLVF
jgi:hypothetical protein